MTLISISKYISLNFDYKMYFSYIFLILFKLWFLDFSKNCFKITPSI